MAVTLTTGSQVRVINPEQGMTDRYIIEAHYDDNLWIAYPMTQDPEAGNSTSIVRVKEDADKAVLLH